MDTQPNAIKLLQLGPQNPIVSVLLTQKCDGPGLVSAKSQRGAECDAGSP